MSKKQQEELQQEQLSAAIDALNCGCEPEATTAEITELLAVAAQVKQISDPAVPSAAIIGSIVDTVASELEPPVRQNRRRWLFSGAVSTAAAVVVLSVLNLWPALPGQSPSPVIPPLTAALPISDSTEPPSVTTPTVNTPVTSPAAAADNTQEQPNQVNSQMPISKPEKAEPRQRQISQPIQDAAVVPKAANINQAAAKAKPFSKPESKSSVAVRSAEIGQRIASAPMTVLTLPDRQADAVSVEQDGSVIRQIYNQGKADEVVITQRRHAPDAGDVNANSINADKEGKEQNKVSLTLDDMEVTVAGAQAESELRHIAQSLKPASHSSKDSQ